MKITLALLTILLLTLPTLAQESIWFDGSFDDAKSIAQEENKLILIDFTSDF